MNNKILEEKLNISKESIDLIRSLVVYSDDNLGFFKQIIDYLYRLGHSIEARENEKEYPETLHKLCELINEVYKK